MAIEEKAGPDGHLPKAPTGIQGLDEITLGGLPRGRPTLVCGPAGCGKTLLGMEFLVRGVLDYDEPGVFVAFEETADELIANVRSFGWDLQALVAQKKLLLDHIRIERSEIEETGEYDLEGLFIRLGLAIDSIGAKRIVLDTIEALFGGFGRTAIVRAELRRLFRWLKDKGMTAIITGESGERTLTRYGIEEYVSDCVIALDHRVYDQIATRRLRVLKYRGSRHGTNEYPFLIGAQGLSVLPITSLGLDHGVSSECISTGIPSLDEMFGGQGYYRGSSVLISGMAGAGKTCMAAHFAHAACQRGERCLYFAFEESPHQIVRNMRSIGLDLEPWVKKGLLRFEAARPTVHGLEMHLTTMHHHVARFKPRVLVVDPISNFVSVGVPSDVKLMLMRLLDYLKSEGITALCTHFIAGGSPLEGTDVAVSSLMDSWLLLRTVESNGERNRIMYIIKSRGMAHSNQMREFVMTDHGVELIPVYLGPAGGIFTGTARYQQEARERATMQARRQELEARQRELEHKRQALEARIAALRAEFEAQEQELQRALIEEALHEEALRADRAEMARRRHVAD